VSVNIKLTKELEFSIQQYEQLSLANKELRLLKSPQSLKQDTVKYARFVEQRCEEMPEVKVYFADRLKNNKLSEIVATKKDTALLICLQVICDIIVHNAPSSDNCRSPKQKVVTENEMLLQRISQHNFRMARINKEIAKSPLFSEAVQGRDSEDRSADSSLIDE
jgi:hypothetical protein